MKKVVFNQYSSIDDLQMTDVPIPSISSDELLIRVRAVSINPIDWKRVEGQMKIMTGSKFPKGIAIDFSGIVERTGSSISNFKTGEAVFGCLDAMKGEALAEFIAVKETAIYKKPEQVSFETAAAAVTAGVTALYLLEKSHVKHGDHLLINGASGGVGMAALQMAKQKRVKVTAAASGKGLDFIKKWNPDNAIDYTKSNIAELKMNFDAIFELSGSLPFNSGKAILKPGSSFVSTLPNPVDILKSFLNNLFSSKKFRLIMANPTQDHYRQLCEWLIEKGLELPIARVYSMNEFREAYQFARNGRPIGKVVITLDN